jgi:hypothetical protein
MKLKVRRSIVGAFSYHPFSVVYVPEVDETVVGGAEDALEFFSLYYCELQT